MKMRNWSKVSGTGLKSIVHIDMSIFKNVLFEDVKQIREKVDEIFAPQNIKMISKRAERHYPNGYCVYVLYCNRC
jgi:hypothetical protein